MAISANISVTPGEDGDHPTFCRLCEAFCGMIASVEDGVVTKVTPDRANPHSKGHICIKGPAVLDITYDPDRVLRPLKRVGAPGEFVEVGWDEALDDICRRMKAILDADGPDAIAAYFGNPGAFSTDAFMGVQWFLARLGSRKFYTAGSQDSTSRHLASHVTYGVAFRNSIPDLTNNDFLIILGANPLVSHGGLLTAPRVRHDLDAIAARGRVVVIDPRRTETAERFEHFPIQPDSDPWLLAAMLGTIIDEGLADEAFLRANVTGWETLFERLRGFDADKAADRTGIAADAIRRLTRDFVHADRAALYSRVGICRGRFSTIANFLVDAINIAAGKFAKVGGSVFGVFPFGSGAELLQGYGVMKSRLGDVPVIGGMVPAGVLASDILQPGAGRTRAMILVAGNPMLSAPGVDRYAEAFEALDLFISCDLYVTESNRHAHYVLPAATFLEKPDIPVIGLSHMPRPFIQYSAAVIEKRGEARDEMDIFSAIAEGMGLGSISPVAGSRPLEVLDQALRTGPMRNALGDAEDLSIDVLARHPHGIMLDVPLSYEGWRNHIETEDGRLRLWHPIIAAEFDRWDQERAAPAEAGLRLFSQRKLKSLNSWMHNPEKLVRSQSPTLLIHPRDASARNIASGDHVSVASRHAAVEVCAQVSDTVMPGSVCYPHGWGHNGGWLNANRQEGANINRLLGDGFEVMEPASGVTFIDGLPVEVTRRGLETSDP